MSEKIFFCIFCNYQTTRKCNYNTHLKSKRHHKNIELSKNNKTSIPKNTTSIPKNPSTIPKNNILDKNNQKNEDNKNV